MPTSLAIWPTTTGPSERLIGLIGLSGYLPPICSSYLFWTNHLHSARIERIAFPNQIKTTVVRDNLVDLVAVAVDQELDFLIWSDATTGTIEYSNLNGQYRRTLYREDGIRPISLTTHSKYLFWVEKDQKAVEKLPLDLNLGNSKQTIFLKDNNLTDIIAVTPMKKNSSYLYCQVG